jgi:hypothetical protein
MVFNVGSDALPVVQTPSDVWTTGSPVVKEMRFPLGINNSRDTNNTAEAQSMHNLISQLFARGYLAPTNHTTIHSDSKLVINQLLGFWKVNNNVLMSIYRQTHQVFNRYTTRYDQKVGAVLDIQHIPGTLMKEILGH